MNPEKTGNQERKITNMTEGSPFRLLLFFALPLMAGNVFQELYTVTDTAIVGRALGVQALAALGNVSWLNWLYLSIIQGITQGFSILLSQRFGANDREGLKRAAGNAVVLCLLLMVFLTVTSLALINPALHILGTPQEIRPIAVAYLHVMFGGLSVTVAYNLFSSMLRALGDSRTPLISMVISSAVNVSLDLLFVMSFGWGVTGAAAETVIAQALAALFCLIRVSRTDLLHLTRRHFTLMASDCRKLFTLALPMAFQNLVISIGGMIVQVVVNRYGVAFIAGYTATTRLYGLLEMAAISYGFAMTTYAGQNMGAGNTQRIREGVRAALVISMLTSALITLAMFVFGRNILSLFIDVSGADGDPAMATAYLLLRIMSALLPVLYVLHIIRSCIQGMGNTVIPMLSGVAEFIMRTGAALLFPVLFGETGILFAEVVAWAGADLVLIPGYFLEKRKIG